MEIVDFIIKYFWAIGLFIVGIAELKDDYSLGRGFIVAGLLMAFFIWI